MSDRDDIEGVNPDSLDVGDDTPTEFIPRQSDSMAGHDEGADDAPTRMFPSVNDPEVTRAYSQTQIPEQDPYWGESDPSADHRPPYEGDQQLPLPLERSQGPTEEDRLREEELRRQEQEEEEKAAKSRRFMLGGLSLAGVGLILVAGFTLMGGIGNDGTGSAPQQHRELNPAPPPANSQPRDEGQLDGLRDQIDGLEEQNRSLKDRLDSLMKRDEGNSQSGNHQQEQVVTGAVPPIIGETVRSARNMMSNNGFSDVSYVNTEGDEVYPLISLPSDVVVDVTPLPGTQAPLDAEIRVIVDKER